MPKPTPFLKLCIYSAFVVCPLLFFTDLTRNPYFTQIVLLNLLICTAWLVWIWQAWKAREWTWTATALDPYWAGLLGICMVSWLLSFYYHPNLKASIFNEGARAYLFLVVNSFLVYAGAIRFQDRDRLRRILLLLYAVTFAASAYAIAQYYGYEWFWPQSLNPYGSRPVSTFGNPNFLSSFLVVILPVIAADFVFRITGLARVPLFVVMLTGLGALLATLTRSSWGGLIVAMGFVAVPVLQSRELWPKYKKPVMLIAGAMLAMAILWPKSSTAVYSETVFGRLAEVKQVMKGTYGAVTQRLMIWLCSWQMVLDHPFLGKGWGTYELFFPFYQGAQLANPLFAHVRTHANNSHNEILEYWAQVGTVGLGLLVALWAVFFRTAFSVARRMPQGWKALAWGIAGGVAGMLVDNLLNVSVHFAVPAFIFWWWVGSIFVFDADAVVVQRYSLLPIWRRVLLGLSAVLLVVIMARNVLTWEEEVNFFKGFKYSKGGADLPRARGYLEKAYGYFSRDVNNNYELANVYARLGMKEKALEMYQASLDANAGYDEIYFNRATMLMQLGQEAAAVASYRMALAINPLSREAYSALANIYMHDISKYGDEGAQMYRKAVSVFPEDRDMWVSLGYLAVQRQQWQEAFDAYQKALTIDPNFEIARKNLQIVKTMLPINAHRENANTESGRKP
jgi:O-antigen ligase